MSLKKKSSTVSTSKQRSFEFDYNALLVALDNLAEHVRGLRPANACAYTMEIKGMRRKAAELRVIREIEVG